MRAVSSRRVARPARRDDGEPPAAGGARADPFRSEIDCF
jgi:hypothetical protein